MIASHSLKETAFKRKSGFEISRVYGAWIRPALASSASFHIKPPYTRTLPDPEHILRDTTIH